LSARELDALLRACVVYRGGEPDDALVAASRALERVAGGDPDLWRQAALAAEALPVIGAGWVGTVLGSMVEQGRLDAGVTFDSLWRVFMACCEAPSDEAAPGQGRARSETLDTALQLLGPAIVSHLAALPQRRATLLDDPSYDKAKTLSFDHFGAFWICEAIERSSGDLLLLHAPSRRGWRARYENVAQCFHLFSLLQAAVGSAIPGGREPDAALAAAARGEPVGSVLHDQAWWHYQHPGLPRPEAVAMVPGDLLTRHLREIDGLKLLMLWNPILAGRGWESGSFGAHLMQLPASFELRESLADDDCAAWFERAGLPAAGSAPAARKRPWWKPF
jgi:hypothetical protein